MAVELEQKIMNSVGLGQHYGWYNGSGSCRYIRQQAVELLPKKMKENGLKIDSDWLEHCRKANRVDNIGGGEYRLTNTWIACSYAIQDGIYRSQGDKGFKPTENWYFFSEDERRKYEMMDRMNERHFMHEHV